MEIPPEWVSKICSHKEWYRPPDPSDFEDPDEAEEAVIQAVVYRKADCSCKKYRANALGKCIRCFKVAPANFAHPSVCFRYAGDFICWPCRISDGSTAPCACNYCARVDFWEKHYDKPFISAMVWGARSLRFIPPPADFVPIVYDFNAIFEDLGIDL